MSQSADNSLLHLLHRAVQIGTDRFDKSLGVERLTARQLVILQAIDANPGASQMAITAITGVDRSTMADIVRRLAKRHLVIRKRTKEDARAYALSLTEDGRKVIERAEPVLRSVEKQMLATIPSKSRAEWIETLRTLGTQS